VLGKSWRTATAAFLCVLLICVSTASAQAPIPDSGGDFDVMNTLVRPLVVVIVFTLVGLILFGLAIFLIVKLSPFSVVKEIEEDQNTSLGIIIGSVIIGIAIVLAAALIG